MKKSTKAQASAKPNINNVDLSRKFVFSDKVEGVLKRAYQNPNNSNVVLWGQGGYNKSGFAEEFFNQLGVKPFIKSFGIGTKVEDLFGGLDMKHFNKTEGEIQYLLENSFLNHEYVILEEFFDVVPSVLEQLKDPIQSGVYRNGNQQFKIKTKMIIICTNRPKSEIAQDTSLKALMERFMWDCEVKWPNLTCTEYSKMFEKVTGNPESVYSRIVEACNEFEHISPRIAMQSLPSYKDFGVDGLRGITGFSDKVLGQMLKKEEEIKKREEAKNELKDVQAKKERVMALEVGDNIMEGLGLAKEIAHFVKDVKEMSVIDENFDEKKSIVEELTRKGHEALYQVLDLVESTKLIN